jgi:hypothetical protein
MKVPVFWVVEACSLVKFIDVSEMTPACIIREITPKTAVFEKEMVLYNILLTR